MPEQGSEAWRQDRCGVITASRFADVLSLKRNGEPAVARNTYMFELIFERLSGQPKHALAGKALSWGTDIEAYAREAYELKTGNLVVRPEFTRHPDHPFVGASSDGWVDDDGVIEIKCPMSESIHVHTMLEGMPPDHIAQVQGNLLVTGRAWVDFISYDPRQAAAYRLFHERYLRDEIYIKKLLAALLAFENELNIAIALLAKRQAA